MTNEGIDLLRRLTEAHGCSGCEYSVRKIFSQELEHNLSMDNAGSIICKSEGGSENPRIMLEAHMDEVGFMVQAITKNGTLKIVEIGGWWPNTLLSQRVRILTASKREIIGVIACKPPHFLNKEDRNKIIKVEDMVVDVGAGSKEEVTEVFGITIGDFIVPESSFTEMANPNYFLAKAFDNRVGVALAIQATHYFLKNDHPNTLFTVGTVQEEVGVRGAQTAVHAVNPDVAIILEATPADDFPGSIPDLQQGKPGEGVQIRLMDPSAIMNRPFSNFVIEIANNLSIPHQIAVRRSGGTDARAIQQYKKGVPSIVLGVPARYIHTHNSLINIEDYVASLKLITEVIEKLDLDVIRSFN